MYGKVVDVYVPEKRDRRGRRFGYARLAGIQNANRMEKQLNEIWIGTYKLRVKVADKLQRKNAGERKEVVAEKTETAGRGLYRMVQPGQSYAQAVAGPVLLNAGNMAERVKEKDDLQQKIVRRVPLKGWSERCFVEIASTMGEVLLLHEDTSKKTFLCDGRVLILSSDMNKIATSISLMVDGQLFELQVTQEEWRVDPDWWLSDNDRQSETRTESGFLSEQDCYGDDGINAGEIGDSYGDSIDEVQSKGDEEMILLTEDSVEGVADLNLELMHHEIVEGDNGPVSVIGPEDTRCDGLEMGCIGPNQEGVGDKVNGLIEEVATESPSVKGQGATGCVIEKRRNIGECYPEDVWKLGKRKHNGLREERSNERRGVQESNKLPQGRDCGQKAHLCLMDALRTEIE
ncbi:hypothetical protein SLEP1_g6982 [Rubroshorea leprosula]|uniref:RRM domain-containing protein n=1 Tax=Rubroshorea leprosula TaxID=152421 RepID=A0AAV5I396_9ROSI|nr:hypothetical protein SLEP1_g6982 [Rubroshorea leprosula]